MRACPYLEPRTLPEDPPLPDCDVHQVQDLPRDVRQHSEMIHDEIPDRCMLAQSSYDHLCGRDDLRIEESCDDQCQEEHYSTDEQSRIDAYVTEIPDVNSCY